MPALPWVLRAANLEGLRDRSLSHFAALGIPVKPEAFDALLERTEKEGFSPLELLDLALGEQAAVRRRRSFERRIREARFAETKTLEGFDWEFNWKTISRAQVEELATGDFPRRHANLILVGPPESGRVTSSRRSGYGPARSATACHTEPPPNRSAI